MVKPVTEQLAIGKPGQRIVERQAMQLRLCGFQLGQVTEAQHHPIHAGHRQHGCERAFHIPPLTLRIAYTTTDHRHLLPR